MSLPLKNSTALNRIPTATYRVQFHPDWTLAEARDLVPYLEALGISDLYASPLFKARQGSLHGYSVTNPQEINPELGGRRSFEALTKALSSRGMGLLLDVVPNHLALSQDNPWWWNVLESGPGSPYAVFFDIDWYPPQGLMQGKVLIPVLGAPYGQVLEGREISLDLDPRGFFIRYYEHQFPVEPRSWLQILTHRLSDLEHTTGESHPAVLALRGLIALIKELPGYQSSQRNKLRARQHQIEGLKKGLWNLVQGFPEIRAFLEENLRQFNGIPGDAPSFDLLEGLLREQPYRLACWLVALEMINYRRFFSINDLIGIRVEDPAVFEAAHAGLWPLIEGGKITGLRIDHIDGLYDPEGYLQRLQQRIRQLTGQGEGLKDFYILVENILMGEERVPGTWPVAGTSGYDFLGKLNGLLVHPDGLAKLKSIYRRFSGERRDFQEIVAEKKKLILRSLFGGEVESLTNLLVQLADGDRQARDVSRKALLKVLEESVARLPVYRTYLRDFQISPFDRHILTELLKRVRRLPDLDAKGLDFLERIMSLDNPDGVGEERRQTWLSFLMRWQQFTGPIMAKGLEDTALYVYHPLLSLNEVGGGPQAERLDDFHRFNRERQQSCPFTLNATSTHDTKRSEDVRARLQVLSEIPEEWEKRLNQWTEWNAGIKMSIRGLPVPGPNEEIFIYQTLLGVWPLLPREVPECRTRLETYLVKAAREAKVHTRWIAPHLEYEQALVSFLRAILDDTRDSPFLDDLLQWQARLAFWGALNSLSQVLLKSTSPGVPDFYQGTELWDFSLVDPDNRRPVDFKLRRSALRRLLARDSRGEPELAGKLLHQWPDGLIKMFITAKTLRFRRAQAKLFQSGAYLPLAVQGVHRDRVAAFARVLGDDWTITVAGRFFSEISGPDRLPLGESCWGGNALVLPKGGPRRWRNVLTGEEWEPQGVSSKKILSLSSVFGQLPQALLTGAPVKPVRRRIREKLGFDGRAVWDDAAGEEEEVL